MYAILKHGGHQYRVTAGDRLLVDRLVAEVGSRVTLEPVLLIADGDSADVGVGAVGGAHVTATVVAHRRGRKLRVFTYKPKKRRRRTLGYRSQLTELLIEEVSTAAAAPKRRASRRAGGDTAPAGAEAQPAAAPPRKSESAAAQASAAGGAESTATGDATESAPDAEATTPAEKTPAKRAARPRRKADGA